MLTYPQSLTSNEGDACHAALTPEGEAKLAAAQEAGDAVDLTRDGLRSEEGGRVDMGEFP